MVRVFRTVALLLTVALAAACSVKDTPAPSLSGPSELSLSLSLAATPDTITQDGTSQALVIVTARDVSGRAVTSLPIRLEITRGGQTVDYGTLSSKNVVTGSDGLASAVYTAPAPPGDSASNVTTVVTVVGTPVGSNYAGATPRSVDIRLMPYGAVYPPGSGPAAAFTVLPASTGVGVPAVFNGSGSSSPVGVASYVWDFGDGSTGNGVAIQHAFATAGTYYVRLTITDNKGQTAWTTKQVTVGAGPTANFTWTPVSPNVGDNVDFDATSSWAVPPATIVSYDWDFNGDGVFEVTNLVTPTITLIGGFGSSGPHSVTLRVHDSSTPSLAGTVTKTITVK